MPQPTRRSVLATSGLLAGAASTSASAAATSAVPSESPLHVVCTAGHPGDAAYGCGGTIAKLTDLGHRVTNLYLNRGEWSKDPNDDPAPVRMKEAANACDILGARAIYADQKDGESIVDAAHYASFRKILEAEKPNIVLTHWPLDNHADHRALAMLVYDAWHRMGHRFALYYYEVTNGHDTLQFAPTDYVDISDLAERKKKACYAHASQSPDRYYGIQETVTKMRGIENGCEEAEGFIKMVQSPPFRLPA